ncbi:MAG: glycosyltransferase family 39 protein [Vicinamibacteria bacterium]|nr:glycosyltransferase family 39 protein [Vicinamibacteria bacterium]
MKSRRREWPYVAALILAFALGLAGSWRRWGGPLVDCGREMNQPLRILHGERLYADIGHIYGPLAPYFNAFLYRLFGPSLGVLQAAGAVSAALILALCYIIARRLTGPAPAFVATLLVMWLCAFKQSGNFIVPYAYAALYGCALATAALLVSLRAVEGGREGPLLAAGVLTGLAFLTKTEMGASAAVAALAAAMLGGGGLRRIAWRTALVFVPAATLVAGVYGALAAQVGWRALTYEGHLFYQNLPAPILYYNKRMFGFENPWDSLLLMGVITLRLAFLAALLLLAGYGITPEARRRSPRSWRRLILAAAALAAAVALTIPLARVDFGPFLPMPAFLIVFLIVTLSRHVRRRRRIAGPDRRTAALIVVTLFALAGLARMALRVRSGGAYSSYLLPASVILFVHLWQVYLPRLARFPARAVTRRLALAVLFTLTAGVAIAVVCRYRGRYAHPLRTPRGTMVIRSDQGEAFESAMRFIEKRTAPGETVAVLPEGTSLLFFTGRRNPFNEEIVTPGLLDEERSIRRLKETDTRLIFIANRPTVEFGADVWGRDYELRLADWIEKNYNLCGTFGAGPEARLGDRRFFFRAYCRI